MAENEVKSNKNTWYIAWALILVGAVFAASQALQPKAPTFEWRTVAMDGHRTGVECVTLENVNSALGTFDDEGYMAPDSVRFAEDSPVPEVAALLIESQPRLAPLKKVIGHSAAMLMDGREDPDLPLANLVTDAMRNNGQKYFKVPMDLALLNFGGIRCPLPEGAVTLEDITSMFPFLNYLAYAKVKGSAVTTLFEQLSGTKAFQAESGAVVRVKNHQLDSATVGGKPIDPDKVYNLITIDFLLDGGDGIRVGALADKVTLSHVLIRDLVLAYIEGCEKKGLLLEGKSDGRVIMED